MSEQDTQQQQVTDQNAAIPAGGQAPNPVTNLLNGGVVAGAPDLATSVAQAFLTHSAQIAQNSVVAQKARDAQAAKETAAAAPVVDRPTPPPGSFGSKLIGAAQGVMGDLGDAAHATDRPGGWLSGVVNTLNARNQRIAQQQKDAVMMAKAQAENVALHRNFYQQDTAHRADFYAGNQKFLDKYEVNHDTEKGVSYEQLMKRMQTDPQFANKFYVRATGELPVASPDGKQKMDQYGNPVTVPTYTLVSTSTRDGQPDDKEIDDSQSTDYNKYLGVKYPTGTKLTGKQMYALDTQAQGARQAAAIVGRTNGKAIDDDALKILSPYLTDPTVQEAVAAVPGNAYAGIAQHMNNADLHLEKAQADLQAAKSSGNQAAADAANAQISQFTQERQKLSQFAAQAINPKQVEDYEKKSDDAAITLRDMQKKADAAHGEEAAAMAASTQQMMESGRYTPGQQKVLKSIHDQVQASAKASQDWEIEKAKRTADVSNALAEGDSDVLVDAALNYQLDPNKLYSMRKNTNAEFKAKMLQKDPTWSEAVYKQRYSMQQELASDKPNSMGGQIESLNRFALHTGEANKSIQGLRNLNSPIINKPLNAIKSNMVGFEEAQAFKIKAETAKDEYLNFIKSGHVPPTEEEERLAASVNDSRTPAELQSTFRAMAEAVGARAKAMNGRYNTIMGKGSIPGLLQADSESVLRQFGVDVNAITKANEKTSFSDIGPTNQGQAAKQNQTQQKQQPNMHSTDVQRPKDLPTATGTQEFRNKAGQTVLYWKDAAGKPLRVVANGELPKE